MKFFVVRLGAWVESNWTRGVWPVVCCVEPYAPANKSWIVQNGVIMSSLQTKSDLKVWLAKIKASIVKLVELRPKVYARILPLQQLLKLLQGK